MRWAYRLAESGRLPDPLLRAGIRRLLRRRCSEIYAGGVEAAERRRAALLRELAHGPLAPEAEQANRQHYELPAEFFRLVLGPRMKYSACCWPPGVESLEQAEEAMLELTAERAGVDEGMEILDLGCGWGSFALWAAEQFPAARITAVSNSHGQRRTIEASCRRRGLANLRALTADVNDFEPDRRFDRVVSVEMFEHIGNYRDLLARIEGWLAPGGRLFVHLFCHRRWPYRFETEGGDDWMARHFFSGGLMPSHDLLEAFDRDLLVAEKWSVGGLHYRRTVEAWLANMERRKEEVLELFAGAYGRGEAERRFHRWRIFFLACSELFSFRSGTEWFVSHALLGRRKELAAGLADATRLAAVAPNGGDR